MTHTNFLQYNILKRIYKQTANSLKKVFEKFSESSDFESSFSVRIKGQKSIKDNTYLTIFFCQGERREAAIFIFAMQPPTPTAAIDNNLQEEITEGRTEECQLELSFLALYSFYNMTCITE